jgi:hypothetical protein
MTPGEMIMAQATTSKISNEAVKAATGKEWQEWYEILEAAGSRQKPHKEIAQWLYDSGHITGDWWGQMVTVGYEQHIGRREAGQNCVGDYTINSTKTVNTTLDGALQLWLEGVKGLKEFNSVPFANEPRVSSSEKWRYWRVELADDSAINVVIGVKSESKASIALEHRKLADKGISETWRAYWKEFIAAI